MRPDNTFKSPSSFSLNVSVSLNVTVTGSLYGSLLCVIGFRSFSLLLFLYLAVCQCLFISTLLSFVLSLCSALRLPSILFLLYMLLDKNSSSSRFVFKLPLHTHLHSFSFTLTLCPSVFLFRSPHCSSSIFSLRPIPSPLLLHSPLLSSYFTLLFRFFHISRSYPQLPSSILQSPLLHPSSSPYILLPCVLLQPPFPRSACSAHEVFIVLHFVHSAGT